MRIPLRRVVLEAHRLHDLLVSNRDPLYGYDPISGSRSATAAQRYGLLDRDPRHDRYVDHLRSIKRQYPKCQIEDNIDLELAIAAPSEEAKIHGLEALLERFHDRDAAPEALLRLGIAYRAAGRAREGDEAFAQLIRRFPESIWARQANDHVGPMRRVTVTRAVL